MEDRDLFDLDYYYYIQADIVSYLRDFDCLNHQNKKYLERKGIPVNVNIEEEARKKTKRKGRYYR